MSDTPQEAELRLFPLWREAVKRMLAAGLTYGSTIEREQIAKLCEIRQPTSIAEAEKYSLALLRCTSAIKEELLVEHNMLLATNNDGTYRVIAPKDQTGYAIRRGVGAIAKEMQNMALMVQHTDVAKLTDEERRKNADAQAKISTLADMVRTGRGELRKITE